VIQPGDQSHLLDANLDNTETITLTYSDGKWSSKQGDNGTSTRFNGTVKMVDGASPSTNKLVIATVTGNPTLTFDKVVIKPTDGAALTINDGCALTINTADKSTSTLSSSVASTLMNKGSLTLTGKGLYIGNTGDNNEYYGLDNSGTFTVTDPSSTSVTFYCANTAIHNTGTLANAWMEWRFSNALESYEDIAFAATDAADQSPSSLSHNGKTFATTVTAGKTYRLWKVTNAGGEVRTSQKGLDGNGTPVKLFSAIANAVSVYTEVEDLKTITISDTKDFSDAQIDTIEIMLSKLYGKCGITERTNFRRMRSEDYPILSDLYDLIEAEYKSYDMATHQLYTEQILREVLLGLHSVCKGADAQFFNGHTNITSSRFLVFGVKGLLGAAKNVRNAMLFNILSFLSDKLLTEGNTVAALDELYIWLSNPTAIEYIRNCLKRVRKKESAMLLASQNLEDFDQEGIREMTKPLFSIPPHQFLFNAGSIDKRSYMEMLQLDEAEYNLIKFPQRGVCLYKCGNERYLLEVHAPTYKEKLFGTAGGR